MSQVMARSHRARSATATAAATPAAGPDAASRIGTRRASSTVIEPPPECTSSTGARSPSEARRAASPSTPASAPAV